MPNTIARDSAEAHPTPVLQTTGCFKMPRYPKATKPPIPTSPAPTRKRSGFRLTL